MYYKNLNISDKNGERTVEYAFADEGKVFVNNDGNTVSSVERNRVDEYTEEDAATYDEISADEALEILLGGGEA